MGNRPAALQGHGAMIVMARGGGEVDGSREVSADSEALESFVAASGRHLVDLAALIQRLEALPGRMSWN